LAVAEPSLRSGGLATYRRLSYSETMNWRPGKPPANTADNYEIYDELCTPDGRVVAVVECFAMSPTIYYCNAVTQAGKHLHVRAASDYDATQWAEHVTGLKIDRELSGRAGMLKCRPP
jgi:hypothetical protein